MTKGVVKRTETPAVSNHPLAEATLRPSLPPALFALLSFTSQTVRQASEWEGGNNFLIFLSPVEFMILASLSVCAIQGGSYGGRRDWRKDSFRDGADRPVPRFASER